MPLTLGDTALGTGLLIGRRPPGTPETPGLKITGLGIQFLGIFEPEL